MSTPTEDDLDAIPDGELLALPGGTIPPGWLTAFFGRKAALVHQQDTDELTLELSGDSGRHLMIFPGTDPKEKRRREEADRRRAWFAEQEMQEYRERSDRLLAQIDQQQLVVEKRRKEIEDNALKLHDGRRVYVDGDQYRDEQGRVLTGTERDEAAALHSTKPDASTWQQKTEIDDRYEELKRLKQKVLDDRDQAERSGADLNAASDKLSADEKEFAGKVEARAQQAPVDYGSADHMAAFGDEYTSRLFRPSQKRRTDRHSRIARIPTPTSPKRKTRPGLLARAPRKSKSFCNRLHFPPTQSCQIGPCSQGFHERKRPVPLTGCGPI